MVVTPNSRIRLLKSPIELDNRNQLTFSNESSQRSYFLSLPYLEYNGLTYQRKDDVIRCETNPNDITFEDLLGYNYIMYQNTSYDDKWFYAFITDIKYVNDGMTEIKIETDVIETWKFEINYKPSFIEREHTNNDSLGANTVPEGLETGEYTEYGIETYTELNDTCPVMATTLDINTHDKYKGSFQSDKYEGVNYNIFCGLGSDHYYGVDQMTCIDNAIDHLSGRTESIVCIFMAPQKLVNWTVNGNWTRIGSTTSGYRAAYAGADNPVTFNDFSITRPTAIGSYSPRNNKVLCYPYNYLTLSNNGGGNVIYHYEDFTYDPNYPNILKFGVKGVIVPGCSIRAIPKNYKGQSEDYLEGLSAAKYPICSWQNDIYTNWLTQQAVNIPIQILGSGISLAAGAVTGNAIGVTSGILGISQSLGTIYEHSLMPPQAEGDINSGDISFSSGKDTFEGHKYQIREEFARIIDNFFTMFGYKTNLVKLPNIEGRLNWNYVKTKGLNITGDIPQNDMQKIKDIFDEGITFWHNPSTFLDYSQSNAIV